MIRSIVMWPDPLLKMKSEEVKFDEPGTIGLSIIWSDLYRDLHETMSYHNGLGISAIQVGKPVRMLVVRDADGGRPWCNPRITWRSATTEMMGEGCLSLPGFYENVKRHTAVKVAGFGIFGEPKECFVEGREAQVFQHEIEHLDGKMFVEKLPPGAKDRLRSRLRRGR